MSGLRKIKAWVLKHELDPEAICTQLSASAVPDSRCLRLTAERAPTPARTVRHAEYPPRFTVDHETQMLGSVRPFRRQILISTGKTDWDREITSTNRSLAAYISGSHRKTAVGHAANGSAPKPPGIFDASESTDISILNASYKSIADDHDLETVLVFPDFMVVAGVPSTSQGANLLCKTALDAHIPRVLGSSESGFSTWVLPYSSVITLCSHKRRDNRCAISAPLLERAFTESLHHRGWTVDTQLEHIIDSPLEEFSGTAEEKDAHVTHSLRTLQTAKKALILYNSHMGGHRYAGNCIIYTPSGASVWYGRVTPHEVEAIVENTIEGGLVLPPLLRGGLGLSKPGCATLHDW